MQEPNILLAILGKKDQGKTGELDTWKLVHPVRRGGSETWHGNMLRRTALTLPHLKSFPFCQFSGRRAGDECLTPHTNSAQVAPTNSGVPWLGFVVYPTHRRLKRRNVVQFRRRLERNITLFREGTISFAELYASVQGWINHVRYGDTWGLRERMFAVMVI